MSFAETYDGLTHFSVEKCANSIILYDLDTTDDIVTPSASHRNTIEKKRNEQEIIYINETIDRDAHVSEFTTSRHDSIAPWGGVIQMNGSLEIFTKIHRGNFANLDISTIASPSLASGTWTLLLVECDIILESGGRNGKHQPRIIRICDDPTWSLIDRGCTEVRHADRGEYFLANSSGRVYRDDPCQPSQCAP